MSQSPADLPACPPGCLPVWQPDGLPAGLGLGAYEHGREALERDALRAIDHLGREIFMAQTNDPLCELPAQRCHFFLLHC